MSKFNLQLDVERLNLEASIGFWCGRLVLSTGIISNRCRFYVCV